MKVILTALTAIIAALPTIGVALLAYAGAQSQLTFWEKLAAFVVGGWLLGALYVGVQVLLVAVAVMVLGVIWDD